MYHIPVLHYAKNCNWSVFIPYHECPSICHVRNLLQVELRAFIHIYWIGTRRSLSSSTPSQNGGCWFITLVIQRKLSNYKRSTFVIIPCFRVCRPSFQITRFGRKTINSKGAILHIRQMIGIILSYEKNPHARSWFYIYKIHHYHP